MFYEDVTIKKNETLPDLARAYGYKREEWEKIWNDPANWKLVDARKTHDKLLVGDVVYIPITWSVVSRTLTAQPDGAEFIAVRSGRNGTRLHWVQTVNRGNQPIGPNPSAFCVDGCTPDDDLPYYWTMAELNGDPGRRRRFYDYSRRGRPTAAMGETRWRGILSIGVVTGRRITIYNSIVWGWNMPPAGAVTAVGPRDATDLEVRGHLNLLRTGIGTSATSFAALGWTFRTPPLPPSLYGPGDFPMPDPTFAYA